MKKIFLIIFLFSLVFVLISFNRHRQYQSQGNDLAIFDQSAWLYGQGFLPYNTIIERLDYQDRYKPIMLLLGLVYRFFPGPDTLLFLQGLLLAFSGLFVYLIACHLRLSSLVAAVVTIFYLSFPGITSFIIDDFHEVSFFPFFFLGAVYFYLVNKRISFLIFLVLSLVIRDYLVVFSIVFWSSFLFTNRTSLFKLAVIINILMFILMIVVIKLAGGVQYGTFTEKDDDLFSALTNFLTNPSLLFHQFSFPFIKLTTFFTSLGYFLFIPILSFWAIIPILFQFSGRFYDLVHSYRWTIYYHYSGELAALLALATTYKLSLWSKRRQLIVVLSMTISALLVVKHYHTPLTLLTKPEFWQREIWIDNNNELIKFIPNEASVATQNNLAPHLSNRREIFILPQNPQADFVLLDLHENQDRYNFNGLNYSEMREMQSRIEEGYNRIKRMGDSYLYKRK